MILSGHHWSLPSSLGAIRDELVRLREGGLDPAVLILDSMQQHFHNPGHGLVQNRDAMVGLKTFAEEYDISIIFIHHLVKGKHATVESMIGGMTVLQNLSKTIFVLRRVPVAVIRRRASSRASVTATGLGPSRCRSNASRGLFGRLGAASSRSSNTSGRSA